MKLFSLFFLTAVFFTAHAQPKQLTGAFTAREGTNNHLWLFVDGYASHTVFQDDKYIGTKGGPFVFDGGTIVIRTEYNDLSPDSVGLDMKIAATLKPQVLLLNNLKYDKKPSKSQDLDALWRITGRQSEGKISQIQRSDRKTIKILVDGFFQWVAINPAVKGFYGSGGGHYSFSNSKYSEHILFFSRDNSRVGAQLDFQGELKQGHWHHSGKSSKGDPIYEIWSREK